jgi:calcium-dependent protein kinase
MELCEGGDLFTFIRSNRIFSESSAATLLKQIMSAVYYMHKKGVCHRDLKPENMLYDNESGLLKVIDFGTATHFQPKQKFSQLVGTPYYVAPEVLHGNYDNKCDIWSVGVILYVILSGAPPFSGARTKR